MSMGVKTTARLKIALVQNLYHHVTYPRHAWYDLAGKSVTPSRNLTGARSVLRIRKICPIEIWLHYFCTFLLEAIL